MAGFDGGWKAALLKQYRERTDAERDEIMRSSRARTEAEFTEIIEAKVARDRAAHASFAKIPRFFARGRKLRQMLRSAAEARCAEEMEKKILSWEELEQFRVALADAQSEPMDGSGRINYEQLCEIKRDLKDANAGTDIFDGPLSAMSFLLLPRDQHSRISARDLYNRVDRSTCVAKTQLTMRPYDASRKGSLREHELERYIYDFIPEMPLAASMDEKFHAFYVFTAVRRFMFFLDPKRRGRIPIEVLASSAISAELHEMAEVTPESARAARKSWFLPDNAKRVYSDYLELDEDHNGMLSKAELLNFRGKGGEARLTRCFVERVYAEIITYRTNEATGEGEMDFKTYLDLVLAFENLQTDQALSYFWRLLDVRKLGYVDVFAINFFFREIAESIRDEGYDAPNTPDVVDEIFDMVKPANPARITFDDLRASKQAHTVISMLVDVTGFLNYDNREHMMQPDDDDDPDARDGAGA